MNNQKLSIIVIATALIGGICGVFIASSLNSGSVQQDGQLELRINQLQQQVSELQSAIIERNQDSPPQPILHITQNLERDALFETEESVAFSDVQTPDGVIEEEIDDVDKENQGSPRRLRLLKAGLSEQDADWILQLEADVELQALNEQYLARRERVQRWKKADVQPVNRFDKIRDKVGEENYERYLAANGLPTSVPIDNVMKRSPGENAGLQPNDQIVRYDNQRVFNIRDLNIFTAQGEVGENVLIEVERAGQLLQITIPRGPIGISSGRR